VYCAYCGHRSPDAALFCQHCGRRIKSAEAADSADSADLAEAANGEGAGTEPSSPPAESTSPHDPILQPGSVVCSDYEIVRLVAAGVEGEIYETKHQLTGQPAMVKALPAPELANTQADERIKGEARALAKLDHPNLLTLYNFRREGDRYFAVLQIPGGQPLEGIVQAEGPLALPRFHRIFTQVLDGIAYAHQAGLPHGRLTALNVAVDEDDRVKITGFDHFIKSDQEGQRTLAAIRYLAPEQIRNHLADERTDLYAVGVLAYFALAGKVPFDGQAEFDVMRAHLEEAPVDLRTVRPEIPGALWLLVDQALSKKADARAPGARAMLETLVASGSAEAEGGASSAARTSAGADSATAAGGVSTEVASASDPGPDGGTEAAAKRRFTNTKEMFPPHSAPPKSAAELEPVPAPAPAPVFTQEGAKLAKIKPVQMAVSKKSGEAVIVPPITPPSPVEPPKPAGPRAVEPPVASAVPQLPDEDEVEAASASVPDITPAPPPVAPVSEPPVPLAPPKAEVAPEAVAPPKVVVAPEAVAPPKVEVAPEAVAPPKVEVAPEAVAVPEPADKAHAKPETEAAPTTESSPQPASRRDLLQTTPYRGLKIQKGGEHEFFSTEQEFDDGNDDFSDLDDFQPKAQRKRRLLIGMVVLLLFSAAGVYYVVGQINPYSKGENTQGIKRSDAHDQELLAQVYKEDPALTGGVVKPAAGAGKPGMRPAGMTPTGMTPGAMTPDAMTPGAMTPDAMTPDSMTPDAMTPDTMTPDAMTPDTMTPDAMTPAAGGGEAATVAAEAVKEYKRNRKKAEKLAEKALALNPAEPTARKLLAKILGAKAKRFLHSGANKGAASTAARATSLDSSLPGPWFYMGVAKNEMGKKAEAKAALTRYIQLCPKCGYNASYAKQILKSIK
jgi:eukaryotic-like serine/threonine-protein kinase